MDNHRNVIIAIALSFLLLVGWTSAMDFFYPQPEQALVQDKADTPAEQAAIADGQAPAATRHTRTGGLVDPALQAQEKADLKTALASPQRIRIDAPRVAGSINLRGGVVDDVVLKDHMEGTGDDSEPVRLFSPNGTPAQQFAQFGYLINGTRIADDAVWQADGRVLTSETPVTLTHDLGDGVSASIRYSIDDEYMFTVEQKVTNTGPNPAVVQPYGYVNRTSRTASEDLWIAHSGPIGVFADAADYYARCSALGFLDRIARPTLVIHAFDDPWIPGDAYRRHAWEANPRLHPLLAEGGGHVGFHASGDSVSWHDRCAARFLDRVAAASP